MAKHTQPLREEHQELLTHLERLRTVADSVGEVPVGALRQGVDEAYFFLTQQLIPHAQAEDRVLYPAVGRVMGAPEATATMSREHDEVGRLTHQLASLRTDISAQDPNASQVGSLRRVLYSLYALIRVHFAKEEEIYLPLLDARLTSGEARRMFQAMEEAAQVARGQQPTMLVI